MLSQARNKWVLRNIVQVYSNGNGDGSSSISYYSFQNSWRGINFLTQLVFCFSLFWIPPKEKHACYEVGPLPTFLPKFLKMLGKLWKETFCSLDDFEWNEMKMNWVNSQPTDQTKSSQTLNHFFDFWFFESVSNCWILQRGNNCIRA